MLRRQLANMSQEILHFFFAPKRRADGVSSGPFAPVDVWSAG